MNAAGKIRDTAAKVPGWDSEFWHYIHSGDGVHCPLLGNCQLKGNGSWCIDDHGRQIRQLYDVKRLSPRSYNFIRCGPCGSIFNKVDTLAEKYLEAGGVSHPPVPTELFWAIDQLHTAEIRILPLRTCHGAIWNFEGRWVVYLRADDAPAMKRFTLFHEAFHALAHYNTDTIFQKRAAIRGSFNELLADAFAGSILAPKEWVKQVWQDVLDLDAMTNIFAAPKPLICIRLRRMGFI